MTKETKKRYYLLTHRPICNKDFSDWIEKDILKIYPDNIEEAVIICNTIADYEMHFFNNNEKRGILDGVQELYYLDTTLKKNELPVELRCWKKWTDERGRDIRGYISYLNWSKIAEERGIQIEGVSKNDKTIFQRLFNWISLQIKPKA